MVSSGAGHGFIQQIFSLGTHCMLGTVLNTKDYNKNIQIRLIFTVRNWESSGQDKASKLQ